MSDMEAGGQTHIAVVAMSGRFPGAGSVEELWDTLSTSQDSLSRFAVEEMVASGMAPHAVAGEDYVPVKGLLEGADEFDAQRFGYTPREAEILDPQQRVFLECAACALEEANIVPSRFDGRIGVFGGSSLNTYLLHNVLPDAEASSVLGPYQTVQASDKDFLCTRAAYKLGLTGPAVTVQTACSTSLSAVHLASQSLLMGECDAALAGGVSVSSPLKQGYLHQVGGIASRDGACRPFDAAADGTVPGDGVGVVVLRRLEDAMVDGDRILAVIRGTAMNNDGSLKAGYTAPSVDGQSLVIREALAVADVPSSSIGYVEAHGTATELGDLIEIEALRKVFETDGRTRRCVLGSVKGHVGHLDAASGITGFIKSVLMLQRGRLLPTAHFTSPHPRLDLDSSPFEVLSQTRDWERVGDHPRRAGVSSFGIGGTNVHIVLEEAPPAPPVPGVGAWEGPAALRISASTPAALLTTAERLADHMDREPVRVSDAARTLHAARSPLSSRAVVVCRDRDEAVAGLRSIGTSEVIRSHDRPRIAFLFPGQGSQYVGMGRSLHERCPEFASVLDTCFAAFSDELGLDLSSLVLRGDPVQSAGALTETRVAQAALFGVEYALACMWSAFGVQPSVLLGHSVGELVAATVAGVFDLETAVRCVAARGRLVQAQPRGAMLSVLLPEADVLAILDDDRLAVAAVNSTALTTVAGPQDALTSLEERLRGRGVGCRRLHTSHAFHSPSMDGAVAPLSAFVAEARLNAPAIPFYSNVTGRLIDTDTATDPAYWGRHLREPVQFATCLDDILADPSTVLLEVGPGRSLGDLARAHSAWSPRHIAVGTLPAPHKPADAVDSVISAAASLWAAGADIPPIPLEDLAEANLVPLPHRASDRGRHWIEPRPAQTAGPTARDDSTLTVPTWVRLDPGAAVEAEPHRWLVLDCSARTGPGLADALQRRGAVVQRICDSTTSASTGVDLTDAKVVDAALTADSSASDTPVRVVLVLGDEPGNDVEDAVRHRSAVVLSLARALRRFDQPRVLCDLLTHGLFDVTGAERPHLADATAAGLIGVLRHESPAVTGRVVDSAAADPEALAEVLLHGEDERVIAVRGRHPWVRTHTGVSAPSSADAVHRLRDGGVYLITGGLGGVGRAFATHIAARVEHPVLVLVSRTSPEERTSLAELSDDGSTTDWAAAMAELAALEAGAAAVRTCAVDVTDSRQVTALVDSIVAEHGRLDGIIHAAGLPGGRPLETSTPDSVWETMQPKLSGALVLDEAVRDLDLDFFVLCSSVTATSGGFAQGDYAAANLALDAFATDRRNRGRQDVVAVQWGRWDGVGMGGRTSPVPSVADAAAREHPLLHARRAMSDTEEVVDTILTTRDAWVVDDHRLMGHGLVPGTAYLEIVRAALGPSAKGRVLELHDVMFITPVVVPDGATVTLHTTLRSVGDTSEFTVRSREPVTGAWQDHATGWARFVTSEAPEPRPIADVRAECRVRESLSSREHILERARAERWTDGPLQFQVGPRWEVLDTLELGDGHVLAHLALDQRFESDIVQFELHPALLDMAVGVFRIDAADPNYLPMGYGTLRHHAPLTPSVWCHAWARPDQESSSAETITCDLEILAEDGTVLVRVEGYAVKRVNDIDALATQITDVVGAAVTALDHPTDPWAQVSVGMDASEALEAFDELLGMRLLPAHAVISARPMAEVVATADTVSRQLLGLDDPGSGSTQRHPRPDLATPHVAPRTELERVVAGIWEETIGIDGIGVDDDFFALGGHSIAAVQIGSRIRARLEVDFDLKDFYETPTVAHLAALLDAASAVGARDVIPALERVDEASAAAVADLTEDEIDAQLRALLEEIP